MLDLFLDTADLDAARPLLATGVFSGVTTNPTLLVRAGVTTADLPSLVGDLREAGARTVFVQTWGSTTEEMLRNARQVRETCGDVGVKIPVTHAGIAATLRLP